MLLWHDKRVLVADDSQTMRMFLIFYLIKLYPEIIITETVNGADADEWLKQRVVDLILTDLNMLVRDSLWLIDAIRMDLKWKLPIIIIITTRGEEGVRTRRMETDANGAITKPLDIRQFRRRS